MNCVNRFNSIRSIIPENIQIVAVSKTKPAQMIEEIYSQAGHKVFGENRVQELITKNELLPNDIYWHFIGHLQTNKIKSLIPCVSLIQSVDSFKLLLAINDEAMKSNRLTSCLIQFHIAREDAKYGFSMDEVNRMLDDSLFNNLSNIKICGVMGMATFTSDSEQIRSEFKTLYKYFTMLKSGYFVNQSDFREISMGMTDDYQIAIEEGSTLVRIGSGIFGDR